MRAKKLNIKDYILCLLQVPVLLALLAVTYIERVLRKCLAVLANPASNPLQNLNCAAEKRQEDQGEGIMTVNQFVMTLKWMRKLEVRKIRIMLEDSEEGRYLIKHHPNRRLYVVNIPNHAENLLRIANVLNSMTIRDRDAILKRAYKLFNCPVNTK